VIARSSIVIASRRPAWGAGIVVSVAGTNARVFFLDGGRRTVDLSVAPLTVVEPAREQVAVFSAVAQTVPADWAGKRCHHSVYAVLLSPDVRKEPRFVARNPRMQPTKPCVYVGLTGLTPEKRFANHKADHKGGRFAGSEGRGLLPELYERFNPMPWVVGTAFEPYLADALRRAGDGVWQN
jgi:Protein of unknown function (DUF3553)